MKTLRIIAAAAAVAAAAGLAACSAPATTTGGGSSASQGPSLKGTFAGLGGKKVAGSVTVTASSVTLSGFSSDEGPDLHIYLANGTDEAAVAAGKELGAVKSDGASQTFTVSGLDVSKYTEVLIHCDKASAVFGAAPIS